MIRSIINSLKNDSKYSNYFPANKKLSYVMINTGSYRTYEKGRIIFLILHDNVPSLVVKFYKNSNDLVEEQFKKQELIYEKCNGIGISKPLGIKILNNIHIIIEEGVNGKNFEKYISENLSQNLLKLIMEKIILLHHNFNNTEELSTFDALNEEVNQLLDQFLKTYNPNEKEIQIIHECKSIFLQYCKTKKIFKRYSNGDFTPRNLIVNNDKITVTDFEFAEETHLYFLDWLRFFKQQSILSNNYLYEILNSEIKNQYFISALKEFTKYRSNEKIDIAFRLVIEIKHYVVRSNVLSPALYKSYKKQMYQFISEITSRLNEKNIVNNQILALNDTLSHEKEFYQNMHNTIHKHVEDKEEVQKLQNQIIEQEKQITKLVNKKESLEKTNRAISTFIDNDKILDSHFKKIVDMLYLEILHRRADKEGLLHYSTLLEKKKMTVDDVRNALLDSDECKPLTD